MRCSASVLAASAAAAPAVAQTTADASRGHNPGGVVESLLFGVQVGLLGMAVVFVGLVAVYLFMIALRRTLSSRQHAAADGERTAERPPEMTAEVAHAIALALFMDLRTFDDDTAEEVTIRKITRPFSPWMDSGKTRMIFNNQQVFRK